jgi:hypothetical protein
MSCLFDSLSKSIENLNGSQLRIIITEYLKKNPKLFDNDNEMDLSKILGGKERMDIYIQNMEQSSSWGGAIEIKAFCEIFNAVVKVKILMSDQWIEFVPNHGEDSHLFCISWDGSHYEAL